MKIRKSLHIATETEETIVAIATPPGTSGIAVVRISGTEAIQKVAEIFSGNSDLREVSSHTLHYGRILSKTNDTIDEVLVSVFHAPHSYTGEDSVEISCHGGITVSRAILQRILDTGVRFALPGEFTRRAFLNGRMDLLQAEAVADLIHAQSNEAHEASVHQLQGVLSKYIGDIHERLIHCASMLELSLDFTEDDVELLSREELHDSLESAQIKIREALDSYDTGRIIRDGFKVVIAGKPNVGKSSLLNALLRTNRAIVTDIPGTTRDYIEEQAVIRGVLFRFVDTAGLRPTNDVVELQGIRFSEEHIRSADLVCCMVDASNIGVDDEHIDVLRNELETLATSQHGVVCLFNKIDLTYHKIDKCIDILPGKNFAISATTGEGLEIFTRWLVDIANKSTVTMERGRILITNARHAECLRRSLNSVGLAIEALAHSRTEEYLAFELRGAIDALGEIIGTITSEDILNRIFSRFCIGK